MCGVMVYPDKNLLIGSKSKVHLQPQVMQVLCYLADNQQKVVSNDEMIDALWGQAVVSYASVQRCISALRKNFIEAGANKNIIVNYPKKGYQLDAEASYLSVGKKWIPSVMLGGLARRVGLAITNS
ncbi:transcriptional regulator [Alteromonadaceae bacterium 2753L.S.0a.02]|nr:transcriptional regulator [Alteromonadaceae bacterium 2753L.S.0a.02]